MTTKISMNTNYSLDGNDPTYHGERDFLLKVAENNALRKYPDNPKYLMLTTDGKDRPVIGYGYDLIANRDTAIADLESVGVVLTKAQKDAINALTDTSSGIPTVLKSLALPSESAATQLLDMAANDREVKLDKFLADNAISITDSSERAVLLSMWYEAPGGGTVSSPGQNGYFMNRTGGLSKRNNRGQTTVFC